MTVDSSGTALDALGELLERKFRTTVSDVTVGGATVSLLHPADYDDLIREEDFVKDERLPYWADIWPSSTKLAERIATSSGQGRRVLELGCGAGLVSSVAAAAGFEVLATDYYDDALQFATVNAWRHAGVAIETRLVDWRHFPNDLGRFNDVIASDVLYEHEYAPLLAEAFRRTLTPGGMGVVADPGRIAAPAFVEECARRDLRVERVARVPFEAGAVKQTIDFYEIRHRAA